MKNNKTTSSKSPPTTPLNIALTPLQIFEKLCAIPHRSYHTQEMFSYLCAFCKNIGLEVRTDRAKNIYVCKKPQKIHQKGYLPKNHLPKNHLPKICLQAHYDMVGVGKAQHGEKIEPYVDKQFLRAKESSLGADNGAGLASILWLFMQEKYAPHIEAIFTNDEEVGLCGANELELPIQSHFLLNVDSEFFGEIITGCAGGFDVEFDFAVLDYSMQKSSVKDCKKADKIAQNLPTYIYKVEAFGFEGGHSGVDIHREIRSSILDFAHLLKRLCDLQNSDSSFSCELYSLNAGEKSNSIPVGLSAFMGFSSDIDILKNTLQNAGLCVSKENLCTLRVGLLEKNTTKSNDIKNLKTGFLLKSYSDIGDYQHILEQKPQKCYDKELLSTLILELRHGVWERGENGEVMSSLNIAMIKDNSSFSVGDSSLGMQCDKILDFSECTDAKSANIPKNPKNLHSHTAPNGLRAERSKNTRIVVENGGKDFRENNNSPSLAEGARGRVKSSLESIPKSSLDSNTESSLRESPQDSRGNPNSCHTEGAQATEVSQAQLKNRDISLTLNMTNNAQCAKSDTNGAKIDCHAQQVGLAMTEFANDCYANADAFIRNDDTNSHTKDAKPEVSQRIDSLENPTLHFTLKARANTNTLLNKTKKHITQTITNLLKNQHFTASPNISNEYSAWANASEQKADKTACIHPILQMIIDAYKWRHCAVGSIHAGLECGILQERFSKMGLKHITMASIGPTILSPHSLQERLDIDSFYEFVEVLESLIAKICASNINTQLHS